MGEKTQFNRPWMTLQDEVELLVAMMFHYSTIMMQVGTAKNFVLDRSMDQWEISGRSMDQWEISGRSMDQWEISSRTCTVSSAGNPQTHTEASHNF
jgi:hypothetical protein